jgi:hypothetical protein
VSHARQSSEARRGGVRQVDIKTREKEPTMKNHAYAAILAAVVALMAASGASARASYVHSNVKQAKHSLVKQTQHASYRSIDRRWARGLF